VIGVSFDTETTGLVENRTLPIGKLPEIIELYAVKFDSESGETLGEIEFMFCPERLAEVDETITKITGLTQEELKQKPKFKEHSQTIINFLTDCDFITGHNLSYDIELVEIELTRCGLKIEWPRNQICTVEQTVYLKGIRLSLSVLYEILFGEPFAGAHRARQDVEAQVRCYLKLKEQGDL
jgi:DNA polymerase III epsilon subunit-like protein